jgi:hypothetical protein
MTHLPYLGAMPVIVQANSELTASFCHRRESLQVVAGIHAAPAERFVRAR